MAHENTQQSVQEDHPDDNLAPANACDQCCRRKTGCSKEHPKCQRCKEDGLRLVQKRLDLTIFTIYDTNRLF
ncbi:hypothetical protein HBH44_152870 [Parastagonospora nodorum]|nr:hypothetical protein HBH44_152870 [Parastagonospora nodorum]KAH4559569.1 hypothetical protein HBH84_207070 [Parastagonospora nodorum]KAH4628596.1 hypothetical protein HBH81_169400 [Parastagonospora nodorum]